MISITNTEWRKISKNNLLLKRLYAGVLYEKFSKINDICVLTFKDSYVARNYTSLSKFYIKIRANCACGKKCKAEYNFILRSRPEGEKIIEFEVR